MITREKIRELFQYNAETGGLYAKRKFGHRGPGERVGHKHRDGYRIIGINGKSYPEHRLVWIYFYDKLVKNEIDHINGVRDDNRIENLREATRSENARNIHKARKDNRTGYIGVRKDRGRWEARIKVNGKYIHLGCFGSPQEAQKAYLDAKRMMHPTSTL